MDIKRVNNLSQQEFITNYLITNTPLIITGAMVNWNRNRLSAENLETEFGNELVQIYDDLFELQTVDTLSSYFQNHFGKSGVRCSNYVRWYAKFKDLDFFWSDEIFKQLENDWCHPDFLPQTDLLIPRAHNNECADVTRSPYPYKGIFISGEGARTRLHRDPFMSNAVLCQISGKKKFVLFNPEHSHVLMNENDCVDLHKPNLEKFPNYRNAKPSYECTLDPGEILFIPGGWLHDVTTVTDSISITWNFMHQLETDKLNNYLATHAFDPQLEVCSYFLQDTLTRQTMAIL